MPSCGLWKADADTFIGSIAGGGKPMTRLPVMMADEVHLGSLFQNLIGKG